MEINALKRRSKQAALVSGLGFLVVLVAFVYASFSLQKMNAAVQGKTKELAVLESEISLGFVVLDSLDSTLRAKEHTIKEKNHLIDSLTESRIVPKASAVLVPNTMDTKEREIYDFNIWIDINNEYTENRIKEVTYVFEDNSFIHKFRKSEEPSNGFSVNYRGWGYPSVLPIYINYKDGLTDTITFEMHEHIRFRP